MPVVAIYRSSDVDRQAFDRYRAEVPIEPAPKGAIVHQVAFDDRGLLVIDIWEDEAALKAFTDATIVPGLQKAGIAPVEPEVLQLHAFWAIADARAHNLAAPAPKPVPA
jgi:hypothetical protein